MRATVRLGPILCGIFLSVCLVGTPVRADDDLEKDIRVQVMFGATYYDHLHFTHPSTADPAMAVQSEFSWMPLLGVSGGVPLMRRGVDIGLEGGAAVGWRTDRVQAIGGGGSIDVHIHNEFFLVDLFLGPYVSTPLGQRARVYAGAGPLLVFGQYDKRSDEYVGGRQTVSDNVTSSAFGPGAYIRTGVEFNLQDNYWMGFGLRAFTSDLDFDDVPGTTKVKAVQFLITYTYGS